MPVQTAATVALVLQFGATLAAAERPAPPVPTLPLHSSWNAVSTAQDSESGPADRNAPAARFDPYLGGWSSEPAMAYGGLTLASVQRLTSRLLGSTEAAQHRPGLAAAWEFPFAELLSIATHEVNGHGGRAREFDLDPSYGFELIGLTAWTGTARAPKTADELLLLCAGGTEADTVLAHRLIADLMRPDGAEASAVPLALVAKLDLTLYVAMTVRPGEGRAADFLDQYQQGNDIANYLVARQGQRRGTDVDVLWNQVAPIDFNDPLLRKNADAARIAALWNAIDPVLVGATVEYFRGHLFGGAARIRPLMLDLGGVGISAGTRAFLAPRYVTRYLDLYIRMPFGVASIFGRDLDSSLNRSYGWGGTLTVAPRGTWFSASVTAERWTEPESREYGNDRPGWHVSGEVHAPLSRRFGLALNAGRKTDGFVAGRPLAAGTYVGLGVLFSLN
jgi:hypothetical protein